MVRRAPALVARALDGASRRQPRLSTQTPATQWSPGAAAPTDRTPPAPGHPGAPAEAPHLVRYHGVFAPNAAWRREVVPPPPEPRPITAPPKPGAPQAPPPASIRPRIPWAELLLRVFRADVLACDRCGGRRVVLAFITERPVVKSILDHLGLPSTAPAIAPARSQAIELQHWLDV